MDRRDGARRDEGAGARYFPFIDGLRAIAVLAVVAYHLDPAWMPGGFAGVDVFFVISGFVVSASVAGQGQRGFGEFVGTFYARRMRRILPALLVCLTLTGLASVLFIPPAWLSESNYKTGLMAFLGLSNFVLAASSNDYFAPRVEFNPFAHTWSLGVEEQFYLVFPLLFLPWLKGGAARRVSLALFASGLVASILCAVEGSKGASVGAFYFLTSRFWQLAAGVLLYQAVAVLRSPPGADVTHSWRRSVALAFSVALLALGLASARPGHSPWPDGVMPVLGTLGIVGCLYRPQQQGWVAAGLSHPVMVAIGRISYSLYLWHWPTFVLFRWTVGLESLPIKIAALAVAAGLSVASYRWVEQPLRHAPRLVRMPRARFFASCIAVVLVSGYAFAWVQRHPAQLSLSVVAREAADWSPEGMRAPRNKAGCSVKRRSEMVDGQVVWVFAREGCAAPEAAPARVFVVGDSHAIGYSMMLRHHVVATGAEVRVYHNAGCAFVGLGVAQELDDDRCRRAAASAMGDLRTRVRRGDVLFLPSLRLPRLSDQWERLDAASARDRMFGAQADAARREGEAAAVEALAPMAAAGVRIVFEAPKPVFPAPAFRCSDWFNRESPMCEGGLQIERRLLQSMRAPVLASFARIAQRVPGVTIWDPLPTLCPGDICFATQDGRPMFFDGDHLSGHGNRMLLPSFSAHVAASANKEGEW